MIRTRHKIAVAKVLSRSILGLRSVFGGGPDIVVTRHGFRWSLDLREGIDLAIFLGLYDRSAVQTWRRQTWHRMVKPRMIVLDIGANLGVHTLPLARSVGPHGRVIAIEPTTFAFDKLRKNIELNPDLATRIETVQAMLLDDMATALPPEVYASWPMAVADHTHELHGGRRMPTGSALATTLDALLEERGIERVDFIKIDVDGNECAVLKGAAETLRRHQPVMILELMPSLLDETPGGTRAFLQILREASYGLEDPATGARLPESEPGLAALIPHGVGIDVVARPTGF